MTMFPANPVSKRHRYVDVGNFGDSFGVMSEYYNRYEEEEYCCSESDQHIETVVGTNPMAEDESRTESTTVNEAAGSSSRENEDWLQLGIGFGASGNTQENKQLDDQGRPTTPRLIELDLLPGSTSTTTNSPYSQMMIRPLAPPQIPLPPLFSSSSTSVPRGVFNTCSSTTSFLFQQQQQQQQQGSSSSNINYPHHHHHHHQEINWGFRPMNMNMNMMMPRNVTLGSPSSSSLMMPHGGSYFGRPFQVHPGGTTTTTTTVDLVTAGPSLDFRIIDPPRRTHSGLWFMLQASQNQAKQPFLPQIPKSYLRIKDGRMTVRLLMKYLVNKLRLDSESEIEITCRGQQLLPFLTLQHVRDNIWSPPSPSPPPPPAPHRDANIITLLPDSSTTDHVMVLHYARSP